MIASTVISSTMENARREAMWAAAYRKHWPDRPDAAWNPGHYEKRDMLDHQLRLASPVAVNWGATFAARKEADAEFANFRDVVALVNGARYIAGRRYQSGS